MRQMAYKDFAEQRDELDLRLVDVRTPEEYEEVRVEGAEHLPLSAIRRGERPEPDQDETLALICRSGSRSATAARILESDGFDECINIRDGTAAAVEAGDDHVVRD